MDNLYVLKYIIHDTLIKQPIAASNIILSSLCATHTYVIKRDERYM